MNEVLTKKSNHLNRKKIQVQNGGVQRNELERFNEKQDDIKPIVTDLIKSIEFHIEKSAKLLEEYQGLQDIEDLELDDIILRVDTILDKINKNLKH